MNHINKMRVLFLIAGILTVFSTTTFAKHIDESTAMLVGQSFLLHSTGTIKKSVDLKMVYKSSISNNNHDVSKTELTTFFYVFNDGIQGFVIVAGDDNVTPILGYSDEGIFNPNSIPYSVQKWLEEYKRQIHFIIDNNISATQEIQENWTNYTTGASPFSAEAAQSVNPLVQTKWNQNPYENALCPYDNTFKERTVTGCPATAMAQILKYWNYPAKGTGFHSYTHPTYGALSANFGSTTYQWSSMPNTISSSNNAVATLMYHCGVAVEMNYGVAANGGSGSYVIIASSPTPQQTCENAFKTYFGYNASSLQGLKRSSYSDNNWINLLKNELDQSRPIQYAGFGSGGGHTWVCDGYDNNNLFHMNWGWAGNSDGYFQLGALNPGALGTGGGSGGFNSNQQAIIGIQPPSGTTQNYDLQLYSNISMPSTQIWFTDAFNLTVDIANLGTGSFSGEYGAAVFDQNYNFVDWMEIKSGMTLNSNSHYTNPLTFSNAGSVAFVPGTYYVAIFSKTTTKDWTIIGNDSYSNIKQFKIIYSSDIETNSAFTVTSNGGRLIQDASATINVDLINAKNTTFIGQYRISLSNLDGTLAQSIQILNESNGLPYNYHYTGGADFTGDITVAPGTYLLEVAYKKQGSSSWYYAGSSDYSNPIYVIVEAPGLSPDQYESNNTASSAYNLPISFSSGSASKNSLGSNIHVGTDNDFYKINLPIGYDYSVKARLHDSYSSGNGTTYSLDGLFSYSVDNGATWSENYDDVMTSNILIQNGGAIIFHTASFFAGSTGTYLLDMTISRKTTTIGIGEYANNSDLVNLYPNPAKDVIIVDMSDFKDKVNAINLLNAHGQQIRCIKVVNEKSLKIELLGLSDGIYFIQLHSDGGILTKKIVISE